MSSNNEKVLLTFEMLSFSAKNLISFFILKENMNRDEKLFSCSEMKFKFWPLATTLRTQIFYENILVVKSGLFKKMDEYIQSNLQKTLCLGACICSADPILKSKVNDNVF